MQFLAQGWGPDKARERHMRYARALVDRGVEWRASDDRDSDAVAQLVREHVLGVGDDWSMSPEAGGLVALDAEGRVIGTTVVAAGDFGGHVTAIVQHLVVGSAWRGAGVGVVTLGLVPQLFEQLNHTPAQYIGCCAPESARFYQRAGFTVLQPREPLIIPGGKPVPSIVENEHYPCWFYRAW